MSDPVFCVRGNSITPRRALGPSDPIIFNSVSVTSDAGFLSGAYHDYSDTGITKGVNYSGAGNTANSRSFSILFRFAPTYTGAPTATRVFYTLTGGAGNQGIFFELRHTLTTGTIILTIRNEANQTSFNAASFGAWTANTSGTIYDMLFKWDGTTTSNAAKLYIDNTLQGQLTASNALSSSWNDKYFKSISLGMGSNSVVVVSAHKLDEFCIWDGAIDPAATILESGSGALNGASRTSLVAAAPYLGPAQYPLSRVVNR